MRRASGRSTGNAPPGRTCESASSSPRRVAPEGGHQMRVRTPAAATSRSRARKCPSSVVEPGGRLAVRQGALPRSGEEPGAAGAAAGLDEPAASGAPTRLTRGAVRPPRPSKRDGRARAAPALPRPLPCGPPCPIQPAAGSKSPSAAYLLRGFLTAHESLHINHRSRDSPTAGAVRRTPESPTTRCVWQGA